MNEMVKRLPDNSEYSREWTGNDRVKQHYHGRVRLNESLLNMRLNWKENDDSVSKFIGIYQLDLNRLLKEMYIREPQKSPGEVILRFQRTGSDIQVAVKRKGGALTIGAFHINP